MPRRARAPTTTPWHALPDETQLILSREALRRAAETLATHAELLAREMEAGTLLDQGGPEALRLFAAVVRATNADAFGPIGHA
ncbi:MAG: hypothetical protein N2Z67_13815 [Acetobacteraceae bacterium]|nr:hypothetical protein [Acetobacteraceae bacterium]